MKISSDQKVLYSRVDEILWNDWDPIGINDEAPRDEYESYIPEIFSLLIQNKTEKEITDQLYKIATETIGIPETPECFEGCSHVAQKLLKVKEECL